MRFAGGDGDTCVENVLRNFKGDSATFFAVQNFTDTDFSIVGVGFVLGSCDDQFSSESAVAIWLDFQF